MKRSGTNQKTEMTSRERVLKAINHEEPDRVPVDLGGVSLTSLHKNCYENLVEYLGLDSNVEFLSWRGHIVRPPEEVLKEFEVDTRSADLSIEAEQNFGEPLIDDWGVRWVLPEGGDNYIAKDFPLSKKKNPPVKAVNNFDWPNPEVMLPSPDLNELRKRARSLRENTDKVIMAKLPTGIVHTAQFVRGFKEFLTDMIRNPSFAHALLEKITEMWIEAATQIINKVGDLVDIVAWPDDIGTQDKLMMSPRLYRDFIKPRHEKMVSSVKEKANVAVFYHTDGNVYSVLEDFVEIGIDILNPLQTSANDMSPKKVKDKIGDELTFWGGIDTHHVLPKKSTEEVKEEVKKKIDILAPGGGYVVASVHNIQPDVPPQNVIAMLEAAREFGCY